MDCKYCDFLEHGHLPDGMQSVGLVNGVNTLLLIDSKHPGRCVLVSPWHVRELFELMPTQRSEFLEAVSSLAKLVSTVCAADKVNIAFYGDLSDHLHAHIVPKWHAGPCWGDAFNLNPTIAEKPSAGPFNNHSWVDINEDLRRCIQGVN